jgi:hypothetical protein
MKNSSTLRSAGLIAAIFFYVNGPANDHLEAISFFQNIITVSVNAKGQAFIGKDTFDSEGLSKELKQRFWKSYLGTDKMQDKVKLEFAGSASEEIRKTITSAVRKAQKDALTDLCLTLHKKMYEDLSVKQQKKIRTKYPILFQQKFS